MSSNNAAKLYDYNSLAIKNSMVDNGNKGIALFNPAQLLRRQGSRDLDALVSSMSKNNETSHSIARNVVLLERRVNTSRKGYKVDCDEEYELFVTDMESA